MCNREFKEIVIDELLLELNKNQIKKEVNPAFKNHALWLALLRGSHGTKFLMFKDGVMYFQYLSYFGSGKAAIRAAPQYRAQSNSHYVVRVKFPEWEETLMNAMQGGIQSVPNLISDIMLKQDIQIHCTCSSFYYHYSYKATKLRTNIEFQNIPAPITNPNDQGLPCKHLDVVLDVYPFWRGILHKAINQFLQNLQNDEPDQEIVLYNKNASQQEVQEAEQIVS